MRYADDTGFVHGGMAVEHFFDFLRRDIGTGPDDDFLLAALEPEKAVAVAIAEIAAQEPAVLDCCPGGGFVIPITAEIARAPDGKFPNIAISHFATRRVEHLHCDTGGGTADRARTIGFCG